MPYNFVFLGLLVLSLILSANANETSFRNISGRIYGGKDALGEDYPYFCVVANRPDPKMNEVSHCGGAILTTHWVVSATHCTDGKPAESIWVYAEFRSGWFHEYKQWKKVHSKFQHPTWNGLDKGDIVLLELIEDLVLNKWVQPIAIPRGPRDVVRKGVLCSIMGFGEMENDNGWRQRKLQAGKLYTISRDVCVSDTNGQGAQLNPSWVHDSHVCGMDRNRVISACKGDSGSPMVCFKKTRSTLVLEGVLSYGDNSACNQASVPEVWTRISFYQNWIVKTTTECRKPDGFPPNVYTTRDPRNGLFKYNEIMPLFCPPGYIQSGSSEAICQISGNFTEITTECQLEAKYSEWALGSCSVTCGHGTRQDTRRCEQGKCIQPLIRVSTCALDDCAGGNDVCEALECSLDAVCIKSLETESLYCKCLPGYFGNGSDCTRGKEPSKDPGEPLYGEWSLGECEGKCGIGRRYDTRECGEGLCLESLERYVNCRLLTPCVGNEGCEEICDENAACVKFNINVDYVCECKVGFYGNGTFCSDRPSVATGLKSSIVAQLFWAFVTSQIYRLIKQY